MKAKIINGQIKHGLPKYYKHWAGNFDTQLVGVHEQEGFFEVVTPVIDNDLQTLGAIYFDELTKVFTYPVTDIVIDLVSEKTKRKAELKDNVDRLISEALPVGALEKLVLGELIPQSYKDTVLFLRQWETDTYTEIDAFTDPKLLKKYKIRSADIEQSKEMLKAGRKL